MALGAWRSPVSVLRGFVALAAAALFFSGTAAEARVLLTLDDFGAVGDGIANDTQAFVNAWSTACASEEQAALAVPAAKAYRIWPVQLVGPCKKKLKLLIAGTIVAPASPDEWAGRDPMKWLYIYGVDSLSVSGGGSIDGAGQEWWARSCKRKKTQAVHFEECRGVSVQGLTLQNGQQFHLSFTRCTDVKANFLRVVAPADSPNTDGIHLNDTSRVQIMDNLISTGGSRRVATLAPAAEEVEGVEDDGGDGVEEADAVSAGADALYELRHGVDGEPPSSLDVQGLDVAGGRHRAPVCDNTAPVGAVETGYSHHGDVALVVGAGVDGDLLLQHLVQQHLKP